MTEPGREWANTRTGSAEAAEPPSPASEATSSRMRRQKRAGTSPELALRREVHRRGLRFYVQRRPLPQLRTSADLLFPRSKVAVFVHGCFWHRCPQHATAPKSNRAWWDDKLAGNVARDARVVSALEEAGWSVVLVWEHEPAGPAADRVAQVVRGRQKSAR